jgi:hypothetical protein
LVVQCSEQALDVAEAAAASRITEGLMLREDVDEALANVVAVG